MSAVKKTRLKQPAGDKRQNARPISRKRSAETSQRAEDALRQSEERFRTILENVEDGYYEVDLKGNFTFFNPAYSRTLGYDESEMMGMNIRQYMSPETAKAVFKTFNRVYKTGIPEQVLIWELIRKDGTRRSMEISVSLLKTASGSSEGFRGIVRDITERKQAEEQIQRRNLELGMLNRIGQAFSRLAAPSEITELLYVNIGEMLDNRNLYIALCDEKRRTVSFPVYTVNGKRRSPSSRPFGNGLTEYVIRKKKPLLIAHDMQVFLAEQGIDQIGVPSKCYLAVPIRIGERIVGVIAVQDYEREDVYGESHMELLETLAMQAAIALENSRLYGAVQQELAERKQAEEALRESEARYRHLFESNLAGVYRSTLDGRLLACNEALVRIYGYGSREELLRHPVPELHSSAEARQRFIHLLQERGSLTGFESEGRRQDGSPVWLLENATLVSDASGQLTDIEGTVVDITERKQAEEALARQTEELNRLYRASGTLISGSPLDLESVSRAIVQVVLTEFGQANCSVFLVERGTNQLKRIAVAGPYADQVSKTILTLDGPGLVPQSIRSGKVINTPDVQIVPAYVPAWEAARAELTIPLKIGDQAIGALDVQSAAPGAFKGDDERLMSIFAERAALALEHARLYAQTERRVQNLAALRTIDMAISSSFDLIFTLNILLDQVIKQLGVHAADVLILDAAAQTLRFSAGQGFRTQALQRTNLRLGGSLAGQAVRERRIITVQDLIRNTGGLQRSADFSSEGFAVYFGVPLIARGQVKGVLEIFHRDTLELDQEKQTFLEMLTGQAAIAIDSVQLFDNLQSSNAELMMAYDETIEGWSRAMDLRDQDTEGHTQRVTQMTLIMAGKMGFKAEEFTHIRRGALLHDIGKIGIPDLVLRKPGKLDDEEWKIMRTHPQLAYEMLLPINYLRPALDIPYCHHEKWNGSGYPRRLKGGEIPLSARIFALADVYDALISDRPYRKAWPKEKALEYIREQTGEHFDPNLSDIFVGEVLTAQSR